MDTHSLGGPWTSDRKIRGTPLAADTSVGKICVVRCIHDDGRKAWIQMSKKTHTNPLSKREIEILSINPYVASVTVNTVRFTVEFNQLAYEQKLKGVPVTETMRQCGIDPEILGSSRVKEVLYGN